jgi:adenylate cyclase
VRVTEGLADLPPPTEVESAVLRRVGAPANVRLACQLRPVADIAISTLLPAHVKAVPGGASDRYHWGVEQDVTILFCDLRGFTKISEGKLPFDVVFLLNQFLGRMAEVIEDSGGHVDKFMGDGIMAIFGMGAPVAEGARAAMAAARAMDGVLAALNQSMREELPAPLSMGIGLHTGPAILGRIGAAQRSEAAALTALGETVNLASRLESLTKELVVQVIVSADCIAASGLSPSAEMRREAVVVRGISQPVEVYAAESAADLPVATLARRTESTTERLAERAEA